MIVSEGSSPLPSLPRLFSILRRRKYVLAVPVMAGLAFGIVSYAHAPQSYVSEAVLVLDTRRIQVLPTESVVSPLPQDSPVLRTELDLIGSRLMASKVIERLEAEGVAIRLDPPRRGLVMALVESALGLFAANAGPADGQEVVSTEQRAKIDWLLSNLRVSNDGRSYTIFISFQAPDPAYAAKIANAFATAYLDHQIAAKQAAMQRVSDWLGEAVAGLRAQLEASERAAEDFRQKAGLVETNGTTLQAQRVAALNAELVATRSELAGATARLQIVRASAEGEGLPASLDVFNSAAIQNLRADQLRLERRINELSTSGATRSRQLVALRSELDAIERQIADEVDRIVESLSNEIAVARRKEESLEKALEEAQRELSEANHAEVVMAQLEREANANKTIYESYLVRYKQTIEQDGIIAPEAQIISFAEPATARVSPRLSTWLLFGLGLGGSVGLAGVVLREATDRRARFAETLETATGMPILAVVPRLGWMSPKRVLRRASDPTSRFGEAISGLRLALPVAPRHGQSLCVAFTSALAGEGKTTLALALARAAAAAGINTVVVDANFYHPMVEKVLGASADAYLDEALGRKRLVSELVQEDPKSGLRFIAARPVTGKPDLFASGTLGFLLSELKRSYQLVIVDTPDLERASDAFAIARAADRVLFVVQFARAPVRQTAAAIGNMAECARQPDGIVLNQVSTAYYAEISEHFPHSPAPGKAAPVVIHAA